MQTRILSSIFNSFVWTHAPYNLFLWLNTVVVLARFDPLSANDMEFLIKEYDESTAKMQIAIQIDNILVDHFVGPDKPRNNRDPKYYDMVIRIYNENNRYFGITF